MHQVLHEHKDRNKVIPIVALAIGVIWAAFSFGGNENQEYQVGEVNQIIQEAQISNDVLSQFQQDLEVDIDGESTQIEHTVLGDKPELTKLQAGDKVVIYNNPEPQISDQFRSTQLLIGLILFVAVAIMFGGIEAVYSLLGLAFSTFVVLQVIIKNIMNGADPFIVTIIGGTLIAVFSVYMSHGIKKRTTVAVVSILATMVISIIAAKFFVDFTQLFGLGSEDAFYLITDPNNKIDLQGILLAGIIIGTLGVLDDIATSQAAAVDEIRKANPKLSSKELYKRGISVGREHISSLINTLFLAYVGAAMPLMLIFVQSEIPTWVLINSELVAEEIVRTLVGSTALILAVPITTALAAKYLKKQ